LKKSVGAKQILSSRKIALLCPVRISPRHTARKLHGQNTKKKNVLSIFKKKFTPAKSEMQGTFFLFGVAE